MFKWIKSKSYNEIITTTKRYANKTISHLMKVSYGDLIDNYIKESISDYYHLDLTLYIGQINPKF